MADTDEASVEFALKPNQAKGRSKQTSDALKRLLEGLKFSAEGTDLRDAAETIEPRQTFESHRS